MTKAREILYAVVGAGDFTVEKVRGIRKVADRKTTQKFYKDLVKRGRTLYTKIGSSQPTKRAVAQTKAARAQVKGAATSIGRAVRADAKATKSAVDKAAQAS
ncbi:MAG: hypothetical protein ABR505_03300 [Actinomycetota bacterium]